MAASIMDHRWITQPNKMTHNRMDKTNMNPARIHRPCNNCPRPGMKKLHKAAITFPAEPRPIIFSYHAFAIDKQFHADFVPSSAGIGKSMLKCLYIGLRGSFFTCEPGTAHNEMVVVVSGVTTKSGEFHQPGTSVDATPGYPNHQIECGLKLSDVYCHATFVSPPKRNQ